MATKPSGGPPAAPTQEEMSNAKSRPFSLSDHAIKIIIAALVVVDGVVAAALFVLAYWLRQHDYVFLATARQLGPLTISLPVGFHSGFRPYLSVLYFVPFVQIATFWYRGLYTLRGEFSLAEDFINIFKAVSIGSLLITVLAFFYRGGFVFTGFSYSRLVFIYDYGFMLAVFTLYRAAIRTAQTAYRRRQHNVIPILILGANGIAEMCVREIGDDPKVGRRVIGLVTPNGKAPPSDSLRSLPALGRYDQLHTLIRQHRIQEVLITDPEVPPQLLFDTMIKCGRGTRVIYRVVPNLLNCIPRKTYVDQIGPVPMVRLFEEPLSGPARFLKRSVDVLVSAVALLVSSPVWLTAALVVKLESKGPVFYKQERVGMDGQIFLLYKFRSMTVAEQEDHQHREYVKKLIKKEGETNLGTDEKPVFKITNNRRVTRAGRVLRKTSIDELPQILNVFKGEMSLVGPRPPIPYEVELYEDWHRKRLDVKPGLTGLWQVSGRHHLSFEQMVQLDIYYIENWSLWLDLKIILKTLPALFTDEHV